MGGYVMMGPAQLGAGDVFKSDERGALMEVLEVSGATLNEVRLRVRWFEAEIGDAEVTLPTDRPVFRRSKYAV